jgi:FtsP/CotA-like multicopper oxidase with cupredoxin domain
MCGAAGRRRFRVYRPSIIAAYELFFSGAKEALLKVGAFAAVVVGLMLRPVGSVALCQGVAVAPRNCPRPAPGSVVAEPENLRSHDGVLDLNLTYRNFKMADGQEEYCYQSDDGGLSPTLRLRAGDRLILRLKNQLTATSPTNVPSVGTHDDGGMAVPEPCASGRMTALSTNLHFHGMTAPPACHADDVLHTAIGAGDAPFEYSVQVPRDEPPGLYWYHPHVHGFTNQQVLGGASGALIVEGIECANRQLAGLPERLFVIRDQELLHPEALPKSGIVPPVFRDAEGDILNTGTGTGKPAKDLSINYVPVPYPDYPPAVIMVRPSERQLWRVLNASAVTYLDLQVVVENRPQSIGVVALDGIPINENGMARDRVLWTEHVFLPPAGRVEFIFKGVAGGAQARLITRSVDTGPAGENDPVRPLAAIVASDDAVEPRSRLEATPQPLPASSLVWLGDVKPVRTRKLYFSERPENPSQPNSPTVYMITEDGKAPVPYDPHAAEPDITVRQGDVEDWVIENRSTEEHAFHIHQVHFLLTQWDGTPVDEPFLRDTINVPYWRGKDTPYPSVTLRMDFRDPNAVGTFVYHCHLLEHEDGGMMGTIRVLPATR